MSSEPEWVTQARQMRAAGMSWDTIRGYLQVGYSKLRNTLDPDWKKHKNSLDARYKERMGRQRRLASMIDEPKQKQAMVNALAQRHAYGELTLDEFQLELKRLYEDKPWRANVPVD